VQQEEVLLAEQILEIDASISMQQGVLRDYLAYFGGVLGAKNQTEQDRLRRSMSLDEILQDPTLADDAAVDSLASNYRVERAAGGYAGGSVTMVMSELAAITIPAGARFDAAGAEFVTETGFTARTDAASVLADNDRILTPNGDGTYSFQIEIVAVEEGEDSQLVRGALVVPQSSLRTLVKATASEDFIGGISAEDNAALIEKFVYGMAAKAFSGREDMGATLRAQDGFSTIVDDSIIGLGDAEMLRDQHSIFPGSTGGRADWYVRTQLRYRTYGATKQATLLTKTADGKGIWQMTFGREDYPGLYDVTVQPANALSLNLLNSFEITEDIRGSDMSATSTTDSFVPDVQADVEATYSRFQTVTIRFEDTDTDTDSLTEGVSTADYEVTVRAMPLLAEMQDFATGRRVRNVMGDALIKAPVPCFLELSFSIELEPGQASPDTAAIANNLATLVNNYGFSGRLPASPLCDVVHNSLQGRAAITAIDMLGRIRRPDGVIRTVRDTELLTVPDEPASMSSPRTVAFYLDPADVAISTTTASIPAI